MVHAQGQLCCSPETSVCVTMSSGATGAGASASSAAAATSSAGQKEKRTNLDVAHRSAVIAELLRTSVDGVLKQGSFIRVAALLKKKDAPSQDCGTTTSCRRPMGSLAPTCATTVLARQGGRASTWSRSERKLAISHSKTAPHSVQSQRHWGLSRYPLGTPGMLSSDPLHGMNTPSHQTL